MKSIVLPFLLAAAVAGAQPLMIQPEHPVMTPRAGLPSMYQAQLAAASDGTNTLLVWSDSRNSQPSATYDYGHPERLTVCATRLDPHGNVLDSPSLVLPLKGKAIPFWNGSEFVVVGGNGYVRITAAGELLDTAARHYDASSEFFFDAGWSGSRLLVEIYDPRTEIVRGALYDGSMNLVRGDFPISLGNELAYPASPMAANANGFLIAAQSHDSQTRFVTIDPQGNVTNRFAMPAAWTLEVATDGSNFLVARDAPKYDGSSRQMDVTWLGADGSVMNRSFVFPGSSQFTTALTWDGEAWQLVFVTRQTYGVDSDPKKTTISQLTLDRNLNTPNPYGTPLRTFFDSYGIGLLSTGRADSHLLFWDGGYDTRDRVPGWHGIAYGDPSTALAATPFDFSRGAMPEETPAVATAGDVSLLVWRAADTSALGAFGLYAARFDRFGRQLDVPALRLSTLTCGGTPAVATNGTDFLVAWEQPVSIRAMRISHDGRILDPSTLILSVAVAPYRCFDSSPGIAWNGSNYFVLWQSYQQYNGTRITKEGTLLDMPRPLVLATGYDILDGRVATNGSDFLVAWGTWTSYDVHVERVTAAGVVFDGGKVMTASKTRGLYWSGSNYVLLAAAGDTVQAVRITANGGLADAAPAVLNFPLGSPVQCDPRGCFTYAVSGGALLATRIDDGGAQVTAQSTPIAAAGEGWGPVLVFGDALKNIAHLRLAPETPYADTWHLFVSSTAVHGRAVR